MSEPYDYSYIREYHTNIRHGDNVADCGDCNAGKCDVPDLLTDYERLAARVRVLEAACEAAIEALGVPSSAFWARRPHWAAMVAQADAQLRAALPPPPAQEAADAPA